LSVSAARGVGGRRSCPTWPRLRTRWSRRPWTAACDGHPESKAYIGGFSVVDVPSREEALEWAAKIAVACRCAQEVREFLSDPAVGN
jgi:hypothetical protein